AAAILLIVAALTADHLKRLLDTATELQLSSLVEVHDEDELETAVHLNAPLIGINNRNLHTFQTTLETTIKLMQRVTGDHYVVSESGIFTRSDVVRLVNAGVHAVLVGEALMRQKDIAAKVHELLAD
ncbi:MAG: indole-3-glycerol-phosphate synthase TrpC, partial [Armatimonadetes bacterium]|nr:indole-3-glycerol-phosphate synthase TrpC [Armatimonadota bacterium]